MAFIGWLRKTDNRPSRSIQVLKEAVQHLGRSAIINRSHPPDSSTLCQPWPSLIGDSLYGQAGPLIDHQALQATRLSFVDPFSEKEFRLIYRFLMTL